MIGEPVGRGRTAEVLSWSDGRVVKLMLPGFDAAVLEREAANTRVAHQAGVAAPAVYDRVQHGGRVGWVFERAAGESMLDLVLRRPWRAGGCAALLGAVHADMHTRMGNGLVDHKVRLAARIDQAERLDRGLRSAALDRLAHLESGDRVLHGDFFPGNVMVSRDSAVVIDWLDAARGAPAADVARTLWLLSPAVVPPGLARAGLARRILALMGRRYLTSYRRHTGIDPAAIHRWRLPVLAARLAEGIEHEAEPLAAAVARLARG